MTSPYDKAFYTTALIIGVALWVGLQWTAYVTHGITTSVDTLHYTARAGQLLQGEWPQGSDFFYSSYILLIAVLKWLGVSVNYSLTIIQIGAAAISIFAFYKIVLLLTASRLSALIGLIIYCGWVKIYQWNLVLYTDSLFTSFLLISILLIYKSNTLIGKIFIIPTIVFTVLLRPPGIGLLCSIFVFLSFKCIGYFKSKRARLAIMLLLFIVIFSGINAVIAYFLPSFLDSYQNAEIIYPNINFGLFKNIDFHPPDTSFPPILQLIEVYIKNFLLMLKLFMLKVMLLLIHAKPYYSLMHNGYLLLYLAPAYYFAIIGFHKSKRDNRYLLISTFIAFQVLMVGATSENWDGRFLMPVLPAILVFTSKGLFETRLLKFKDRKNWIFYCENI